MKTRIDVNLSLETKRRLELERQLLSERLGRNVSMNELVNTIINQYLDGVDLQSSKKGV